MNPNNHPIIQNILDNLKLVIEPHYMVNVLDLGLIRNVTLKQNNIAHIEFMLAKSHSETWVTKMQQMVERVPELGGVDLELLSQEDWSPSKMSPLAAKQCGLIFSGGSHE